MKPHSAVTACLMVLVSLGVQAVSQGANESHGLVGLRPLPRTAKMDHGHNHGGSWVGTPTFEEQKGNYPFVAEHVDVVNGWLDGDFKTKQVFFEHYWGLSDARDDLDPEKNLLIQTIRQWEEKGAQVKHILICREYDLAVRRGYKDAKPGPFKEDTRILYEKDYDDIRAMFLKAHKQNLIKYNNYSLIQMVQEPSFFATDKRFQPIMDTCEGIAYECHQFNRHWPLETGWGKPEKVVQGAKWTLNQGKEYIFYYGPIRWKGNVYYEFMERDWLQKFWKAGLPKYHPKMHYYLNTFPHGDGRGRPVGPETDPHSVLGFTKWLIQEIKMSPKQEKPNQKVPAWAQSVKIEGVPNLHLVSTNLYRSAQPTAKGMENLKKEGIKTIVNLRSFHSDRDEIGKTDLGYEHIYMKVWHPEREDIVRFLKIVNDPERTPVLLHCQHGADRTGTMCAVYRIAIQGWTKEEAIKEMTEGGFGFHEIFQNLPEWIEKLDIESIKKDAGITTAAESTPDD